MISQYLGRSPTIKVLEFLIINRKNSYGVKEIILGASVKHRNLIKILDELLINDMIYIEKRLGRSNLYKAHEFHPFVQSLILAVETIKE